VAEKEDCVDVSAIYRKSSHRSDFFLLLTIYAAAVLTELKRPAEVQKLAYRW
jgi:hypothetical protein